MQKRVANSRRDSIGIFDKQPLFSSILSVGSCGCTGAVDNEDLAALGVEELVVVGLDVLDLDTLCDIELGDVDEDFVRHVSGQSLDIEAFLLVSQLTALHNSYRGTGGMDRD